MELLVKFDKQRVLDSLTPSVFSRLVETGQLTIRESIEIPGRITFHGRMLAMQCGNNVR